MALRLTDLMDAAVRAPGERSSSSAAALSALAAFLEEPSVDELSRVLGLTSSATVRVVDGLVAEGAAQRRSGADGRVSAVRLTALGRQRAERIAAARAEILTQALGTLTAGERAAFAAAVDKILVGLVRTTSARGWMCRLCRTSACGAEGPGRPCPVTVAALSQPTG